MELFTIISFRKMKISIKTYLIVGLIASGLSAAVFGQAVERKVKSISAGILNERAIELVSPAYPEHAKLSGADGVVDVKVSLDVAGLVTSAEGISGDQLLWPTAVHAASLSRFIPMRLRGQPVRVSGILRFNFVNKRVNWLGFGKGVSAVFAYDNLKLHPVAEYLSAEFDTEKQKLLSLEADSKLERPPMIKSVIDGIRSRLKGKDLWHYDLGFAITDILVPVRDREFDREKIDGAIQKLRSFQASAPEDASAHVLEGLQILVNYKLSPKISNDETRTQIFRMLGNIPHDPR
ncbi:MAG: energy transducer TonB [Pyrinomonadaceae bacterium]